MHTNLREHIHAHMCTFVLNSHPLFLIPSLMLIRMCVNVCVLACFRECVCVHSLHRASTAHLYFHLSFFCMLMLMLIRLTAFVLHAPFRQKQDLPTYIYFISFLSSLCCTVSSRLKDRMG